MQLNSFTVYLVMQADSILSVLKSILVTYAIVVGASAVFSPLIAIACDDMGIKARDLIKRIPQRTLVAIFAITLLGYTVIPSTKTLCAMIVVPAIANSQAVQQDLPEIYNLAIGKLKESLGAPVEKAK